MKNTIIKTEFVNISYNGLKAIKNVSMEIPQNKITALIGASGSGKSTFLRSINRMLDIVPIAKVEGKIYFKNQNILNDQVDVITLRRKIGMVFQNPTPFPKTIYDNVAYGLEVQGSSSHPIERTVVCSLKDAALWDEVKSRLHESAFRLSGGQQQRLCIARALAVKPEIILLDEPCSALDPISTRKIEDLLLTLKKHYTIIIVTHNMHQARRISDYTGFFHLGELVEFGETKHIFTNPKEHLTKSYISGHFG